MNQIIKMVEWQFILYVIAIAVLGGVMAMFIIPIIVKKLEKLDKDLRKYINRNLE